MSHFQQMLKEEQKNRLISIDFNQWKLERLEEELQKIPEIRIKNILLISRKLVQEILVLTLSIYHKKYNDIELPDVFPYLGIFVVNLIKLFPHEKHGKMLEAASFQLQQNKNEHPDGELEEWKNVILFEQMEGEINNVYRGIINKVISKFDKRPGFYNDLLFFLLIHTTEYIALLAPHINSKGRKIILDLIFKYSF